jgi:hypothetical protein
VLLVSLVSLPVFLLPQPVNPWRAIAAADLEAARALLRDNHPGSVPALGDDGFRRALDDGQAQARARVEQISTYAGLEATLRAFALGFGDRHFQFSPVLASRTVLTAGWIGLQSLSDAARLVVAAGLVTGASGLVSYGEPIWRILRHMGRP